MLYMEALEMKKLLVYMDEDMHEDLKELAHRRKTTMAELVRCALDVTFEDELDVIAGEHALEEAIRDCVREHTIFEDEGNDGITTGGADPVPLSPASIMSAPAIPQRSISRASTATAGSGLSPISQQGPLGAKRWGNPNASLYDNRENRTKTYV